MQKDMQSDQIALLNSLEFLKISFRYAALIERERKKGRERETEREKEG